MTRKSWAHDLRTGAAAALGTLNPPDKIDEQLLAEILRAISGNVDLGESLFLRALADSLDNTAAEIRLTLTRGRRGRPGSDEKIQKALNVGPFVEALVRRGWKKEAAVQQAMTKLGFSRSAVLRSCAEYKKLRPVLDGIQLGIDHARARKSANSKNS